MGAVAVLLLAAALLGVAAKPAAAQSDLCFSQLQVLGSHNSYHQAPPQELLQAFGTLTAGPLLAWQYSHPPLTAQLDAGVRAFELDVNWDPAGGRYGQAAGLRLAGRPGWLDDPRYQQPGFKVLHIPDFDFHSSCLLLTECLAEVKAWSDAHPAHLPILLYLEVKGAGQLEEGLGAALLALLQGMLDRATAPGPTSFIQVPDTTAQTFRDLQGELLSVFCNSSSPHGQLLTPDDVRSALGAGPGADLQQLLLRAPGQPCPWPSLSSMRGRVLPILILRGGSSQAAALEQAYPGLAGSVMRAEQGGRTPLPQAAFRASAVGRLGGGDDLLLDLPANASAVAAALAQSVRDAVATGFIVRARADADTVEARAGFTGRRDAIIAAGPQIVATDFLLPANQQRAQGSSAALYSTGYNVTLPGGQTARCLLNLTGTPAAESVPMQMVAAAAGDGIYCGPLEGAPPGKVAFQPESAAEGAVAGGPPPAPETGAAPQPPSSAGSAAAAAPPPPPGSGSITSGQPLVAIAAGIAALIVAVLAA